MSVPIQSCLFQVYQSFSLPCLFQVYQSFSLPCLVQVYQCTNAPRVPEDYPVDLLVPDLPPLVHLPLPPSEAGQLGHLATRQVLQVQAGPHLEEGCRGGQSYIGGQGCMRGQGSIGAACVATSAACVATSAACVAKSACVATGQWVLHVWPGLCTPQYPRHPGHRHRPASP